MPIGTVEQYFENVTEAMSQPDSDYFLGLIVLVATDDPTDRRFEILDGQQRLATTTMLYAAIRQWLRDHGHDGEAQKIQNEFIGISEIGEAQDEPRIIMNITNREVSRKRLSILAPIAPCKNDKVTLEDIVRLGNWWMPL